MSDYCGELTRWGTLSLGNWESPVAPRQPPWRFVGMRRWPGDVTIGVLVRLIVSDWNGSLLMV